METIRVDEVVPLNVPAARLLGAALDAPRPGHVGEGQIVELVGWVAGSSSNATGVQISLAEKEGFGAVSKRAHVRRLLACGLSVERPDVARQSGFARVPLMCGFRCAINLIGLPCSFTLLLSAIFEDGTMVRWAIVRGRREPFIPAHKTDIQPLMVSFLARSGSTWMMHLLAQHPGIVTCRSYPYEDMFAHYWLKAFRVMCQPGNESGNPDIGKLMLRDAHVGPNPYLTPPVLADPGLRDWFGTDYQRQLAGFCMRNIEATYSALNANCGLQDCRYFAEKFPVQPAGLQDLAWELFPGAREIILLRDPRDVLCSALAFNRKRGYDGFGIDDFGDEAGFIRWQYQQNVRLWARWHKRRQETLLVRYEDLVAYPGDTLRGILKYLGYDGADAMADEMARRASAPDKTLAGHRTSQDPSASISRWRAELTPAQQKIFHDTFGGFLDELGYA